MRDFVGQSSLGKCPKNDGSPKSCRYNTHSPEFGSYEKNNQRVVVKNNNYGKLTRYNNALIKKPVKNATEYAFPENL
jgi:hypothetical protein